MERVLFGWVAFVITLGIGFLGGNIAVGNGDHAAKFPQPPELKAAPANPVAEIKVPQVPAATTAPKKISVTRRVVPKLSSTSAQQPAAAQNTLVGASATQRSAYEEARNLIVSNQPYLLKFEDEESYGKVADSGSTHLEHTFTDEEVAAFHRAIESVGQYRNQLRSRCSGASPKVLTQAIDRYLHSLSLFNRKALPLAADITESNSEMILIVNRNVLIDAPVLISRYLQFKKQRFKENMGKFAQGDQELVESLKTVATTLKVPISDADWKKSYGVRENGLEMISMWPRETIFEATERLNDARETVCIVDLKPSKPVQQAKAAAGTTGAGE